MPQMKEKDKTPKKINEMEESNLSGGLGEEHSKKKGQLMQWPCGVNVVVVVKKKPKHHCSL